MKKYALPTLACLVFAMTLGCGPGDNSSVLEDADAQKLAEYEKAIAEGDAMTEGYDGE